ncbi:MAG: group II truncated hemoglobin [Gammaproteobacteria bacterium]|nr:group II truncated hemoglobin [Gammaproteobacteria bacterium]
MQQQTPYAQLGGEAGVRKLVERFYDLMDELQEAQGIRALHAKSLKASREKLFLFLSGWLGGPDLYVQRYGHPRLRARHLPFSIGQAERDQWMLCMRQALQEMDVPPALKSQLEQSFWKTADFMRNRPEHEPDAGLKIFPGPEH